MVTKIFKCDIWRYHGCRIVDLICFRFLNQIGKLFRVYFRRFKIFVKLNAIIITRAPVTVKSHYVEIRICRYLCKFGPHSEMAVVTRRGPPTTSTITPLNDGLLIRLNISPPTRTRVTPGNPASVGNTIVG